MSRHQTILLIGIYGTHSTSMLMNILHLKMAEQTRVDDE